MKQTKIRNFGIIAHIDHGKTTLSDCFLAASRLYNVPLNNNTKLILDSLDLEKERGVTIKANYSLVLYEYQGDNYYLNLIDTPGHADFNYEVMRSLVVCDGVILLVDASKGLQAQTISNYQLAKKFNLTIIPVINKIDLPHADVEAVSNSICELFGFTHDEIYKISAKNNKNIQSILTAIINKIPPPTYQSLSTDDVKGFIYDSYFDSYKGIVVLFKLINGKLTVGQKFETLNNKINFKAIKIGDKIPSLRYKDEIIAGDIGFLETGLKNYHWNLVGETFVSEKCQDKQPFFQYHKLFSVMYACFFPLQQDKYKLFKKAFDQLALNDNSLVYQPCFSHALGFGMRCGFLGSLHLEITQQRLEREFDLDLITTLSSVVIKAETTDKKMHNLYQSQQIKEIGFNKIAKLLEPFVEIIIIVKTEFLGSVMQYCISKRGDLLSCDLVDLLTSQLILKMPLMEVIHDFSGKLSTLSKGYCSYTYEITGYQPNKLGLLEIWFNKKPADYFSLIVHKDQAYRIGNDMCTRLQGLLPQQNFEIVIQAIFNNRIIARSSVKALRKNVTGKCYGGDITRKNKLLEKQKQGKKKLKMLGNVAVPKEVFTQFLTNKH